MKDYFERDIEIGEIIFVNYAGLFALVIGQNNANPIVRYFQENNKLQKSEIKIRDSIRSCVKLSVPAELKIVVDTLRAKDGKLARH